MRDKELRLALVCYGGVSLAIYMHGVVKEILKLSRASAAYHSIAERGDRPDAKYSDVAPERGDTVCTEAVWFELFQAVGSRQQIRVVVDAIAGASAGGINGIFLARALALDLDIDHQRTMWLEKGDVLQLMDDETRAGKWSKPWMHPILWFLNARRLKKAVPNPEVREKLKIFVRSRWLEPPFSGRHMLEWMVDAVSGMGKAEPGRSLVPTGLRLDLYVSLTNFFGRLEKIRLHDPVEVEEREHRTSWSFTHRKWESGALDSDFTDDNVPILGFAARATSSFPGAFPPAQITDLDALLSDRGQHWPGRADFYERAFAHLKGTDIDPALVSYIDGGVVNNKPFGEVIGSLLGRPAHREVDRRIIYIDPVPETLEVEVPPEKAGWIRTILSSVTDIPRNEPIRDDLQSISEHNSKVQRLQEVVEILRGDVDTIIDGLITLGDASHVSEPALVASWRERAGTMAAEKAGYSYGNYLHLKTWYLFEALARRVGRIANAEGLSLDHGELIGLMTRWGHERNIWVLSEGAGESPCCVDRNRVTAFLRTTDLDYRIRRLRFVIMELNKLYSNETWLAGSSVSVDQIDAVKQNLYRYLERLQALKGPLRDALSSSGILPKVARALSEGTKEAGEACWPAMDALLKTISDKLGLEDLDLDLDCALSEMMTGLADPLVRQKIFRAYIGFAFYDVLTLPLTQSTDLVELEPVTVDRISPVDADSIRKDLENPSLKGTRLSNFGAFFSRADRENDYIWGRLHCADRLTDFLLDSAGPDGLDPAFDVKAFRKRLFLSILDTEAPHLEASPGLVDSLRAEIEASLD